jgi:hypothetical protein
MTASTDTTLAPNAAVAAGVILLGIAALGASWALGAGTWLLAIAGLPLLFGLFLLLQTWLLRLEFTATALRVLRSGQEIRRFPYDDWLAWRVFWPGLPVLLYFRETRSLHLLPVLFDPVALHEQLLTRLPHLAPQTTP